MRYIKYFIYLYFSLLLVSCGEDFFDSITEIEIPEHEPQLVLRANFSTANRFQGVKLRHTLGILDSTEFEEVNDAEVTLYEEDILIHTFERQGEMRIWYGGEIPQLKTDKAYTLKAYSPTYGSIEATQQPPSQVSILAATYEADVGVDRYGDRGDEVTIQFQDPSGEENYYSLSASITYPFEGPDTSFMRRLGTFATPIDPLLEDLNRLYLKDVSFDGEIYTTRIRINTFEVGTIADSGAENLAAVKMSIRVLSISKDRYLFEKTLYTYQNNEDNPFAEPVVVHENVKGGSGIFTISSPTIFEIDL